MHATIFSLKEYRWHRLKTNENNTYVSSQYNGSFNLVFSNRPNLTILPTSTRSFSRLCINFRTRCLFFATSSWGIDSTRSLSSLSCVQCSSTERWKTADTRSLVICSWETTRRRCQDWRSWWDSLVCVSRDILQACRNEREADRSWHP